MRRVSSTQEPVRRELRFPPLHDDGEDCALHGLTLRRVSAVHYLLVAHAQPAMEFVFRPPDRRARLTRLLQGSFEVQFRYNAAQRLIGVDDSAGRRLAADEDDAGRLVRLAVAATSTTPGYLLVAYHYDERGHLVRTENAEGHGHSYAYDDADRLVLRRGRKGFQFYFKYDAQGRCIRSMGDDRLYGVALDYAVPGRVTKVTRPDLGVWTYRFTARGELSEIHDPLGGVEKFVRDPAGRQALQIDPNGNASEFVYDAAGASIARIDPLGHRIPLPEDPNAPGPLAHRVAANAAEYEYGRLLDVRSIALPDQARVRELPWSLDARSLVFTRSEANPAPERTFEVPPGILWWPEPKSGWIFNDLSRLVQQRDEFGRLRHWSYDESGNVAERIDFDGGRWRYDYPGWHFLRGLTNPLGHEVRFTYTPYGQVASLTDAGGTRSDYRYDLRDRLVEIRRHGGVRETYTRDAAGNLIAKCAGDGRELLRFEIGPGNLPVRRTLASGDEHIFQYDKSGRPLVASTAKDRVEFAYDDLGNCVREQRNGLGVEHRFEAWRRPTKSLFFGRFTVRCEWRGDTLHITDPGGRTHAIRLLGHGLVERRFSNGSREIAQYDNLGRCLFKHAEGARGRAWSRRYHWSGEGELRRVEDNQRGDVRHEYDAAHRLCRRYSNARVEEYAMDRADNLVAQPGLSDVTLYQGNRLKTANGRSFIYNDRNDIELCQSAHSTTRYGYDSRDQLVLVERPDDLWQADYDALGRRTRKTSAGTTTEYYWNGDHLVAELQADGRLRIYVYPDLLALVPLLFLDYESVDAPLESGQRYVIFADQIGTPCLVEDDGGTDVWHADVAPFGQAAIASGAKIELDLRFPGHYFDAELGLHYNRFRYYDPALGRYLQSDPWGIAGGYNLYAYLSNPLLAADVRGLGGGGDESSKEDDPNKPKSTPDKPDGEPSTPPPSAGGPHQHEAEPSAFPNLQRGGGDTDSHADRVVDAINTTKPPIKKNRSVTVIEHEDGTVSVGLSGADKAKGAEHAQQITDDLNRQHPSDPPTYRTTGQVDTTNLNDGGSRENPAPLPGNCSEPHAAQAAGENPSPPQSYQTVWTGPADCPPEHQMPGRPTTPGGNEQMQPCPTCQSNTDNYAETSTRASGPGGGGGPAPPATPTEPSSPAGGGPAPPATPTEPSSPAGGGPPPEGGEKT